MIKEAFRGVTLGEKGVGLWEGRALDDGIGVAAARMTDERLDWSALPIDDLCACESSLAFADAEGVRFLLPAFLLAQLEDQLSAGIIVYLTHMSSQHDHFAALSSIQRSTVREFLKLLRDDPAFDYDRQAIDEALENYWKDQ